MRKRLLACAVILAMLVSLVPASVTAAWEGDSAGEGTQSNPWDVSAAQDGSITAYLTENDDGATHSLTITGTGAMKDFSYAPWMFDPYGRESTVTEVTISEGITHIGSNAFSCTKIAEVTIPSTVTSFGDFAFYWCDDLTSVTYNGTATHVGRSAFADCEFTQEEAAAVFQGTGFSYDSAQGLLYVNTPSNEKILTLCVNSDLMTEGSETTTVILDEDTVAIADQTFGNGFHSDFVNLKSIEIPAKVTELGYCVFGNCENLETIAFAEGSQLKTIGEGCFEGTGVKSIVLPEGLEEIGSGAFDGADSLTKITIPNSVTTIQSNAFRSCDITGELVIPDSVTYIGGYAFQRNDNITSIKLGSGLETIGNNAFEYCDGLTGTLTIPANITSLFSSAFASCDFSKVVFEGSMESIPASAFAYNANLNEIVWPQGLKSIGNKAFFANSFTTLNIPDSVTAIGDEAFGKNNNPTLTSLTLPESLITIGEEAFYNNLLTEAVIPSSVESIGARAFQNSPYSGAASVLTDVTMPDTCAANNAFSYSVVKNLTLIHTNPDGSTIANQFTYVPESNVSSGPMGIYLRSGGTFDDLLEAIEGYTHSLTLTSSEGTVSTISLSGGASLSEDGLALGPGASALVTKGSLSYTLSFSEDSNTVTESAASGTPTKTTELAGAVPAISTDGLALIPQSAHNWDEGTISGETKTYTCLACGLTKTETVLVIDEKPIETTVSAGDTPEIDTTGMADGSTEKAAAEAINSGNVSGAEDLAAHAQEIASDAEEISAAVEASQEAKSFIEAADETKTVTIVVQPYLEVAVSEAAADSSSVTYDISAKYNLIATTADVKNGEEINTGTAGNAVLISSGHDLSVTDPVTISIPLPASFVSSAETPVYVRHGIYEYDTEVAETSAGSGTYTATFTNPHGFSLFTLSLTSDAKAELNGTKYTSLADALAAAGDEEIVTVLESGLSAAMSGSSRTITLRNNTDSAMTVTINNEELTIEANGSIQFAYTAPESDEPSVAAYSVQIADTENGTVVSSVRSAQQGRRVTLTVTPAEGYELSSLTVTDRDGNEITLNEQADGTYTFFMPASDVTIAAVFIQSGQPVDPGDLPFTDVAAADWFYNAVKYAYENGLMDGVGGNLFAPGVTLNRAMLVQVMWNLEGNPAADSTTAYTDVSPGAWYYDAIQWATEEELVAGYGSGIFGPEDPITREQAALMLYNYAQYKGYDTSAVGDLSIFSDGSEVSDWAENAVIWAAGSGLLNGKGGGILDPVGTATRAEAAQILMSFCENIME